MSNYLNRNLFFLIHSLIFFLLNVGFLISYFISFEIGLYAIFVSIILLLLLILFNVDKISLFKLFFLIFIISYFFFNSSNNNIELNNIVFFILCNATVFLSIYYNKLDLSSIRFVRRIFSLLIISYLFVLFNSLNEVLFSSRNLTGVFENPNSLAISILCPFLLVFSTIEYSSNKIFNKFLIIFLAFITLLTLFLTDSRTTIFIFFVSVLFFNKKIKKKIKSKFLFIIYLSPILVPLLMYFIYKIFLVSLIADLNFNREIWIIGVEQLLSPNIGYNVNIGLNSIFFGINNYGFLFVFFYVIIGILLYFNNSKVTNGLILLSLLSIHEIFESSLSSGFFGLFIYKVFAIILHNYERKRIIY